MQGIKVGFLWEKAMVRATLLCWTGLALVLSGGCTSADRERDPEFQLHKLEQERDGLRQQVSSEQARGAALQDRLESTEVELNTARAQAGNLADQVKSLTKQNRELQAIFDEIKTRPLKRPEVPGSPLPAAVDAGLQALAEKFGDRVWYDRGRAAVSFANDRLFESGSDAVRSDAQAALHELAGVLASSELGEYEVIVVGHTDSSPITNPETLARHPSNWHLSVHRAIAVKDVLVKAGVPAARLGVMGYADNRPAGNDPAQNRRVEVFIVRQGHVQPFEPVQPPGKRR